MQKKNQQKCMKQPKTILLTRKSYNKWNSKNKKALIFDNNDDYDSYVIMPGFRLISWAQTG